MTDGVLVSDHSTQTLLPRNPLELSRLISKNEYSLPVIKDWQLSAGVDSIKNYTSIHQQINNLRNMERSYSDDSLVEMDDFRLHEPNKEKKNYSSKEEERFRITTVSFELEFLR